jgi:hypothetical protein
LQTDQACRSTSSGRADLPAGEFCNSTPHWSEHALQKTFFSSFITAESTSFICAHRHDFLTFSILELSNSTSSEEVGRQRGSDRSEISWSHPASTFVFAPKAPQKQHQLPVQPLARASLSPAPSCNSQGASEMASLPTDLQTAIIGNHDGKFIISHDVPVPKLEDDLILVRNLVIGLNPVDTKMTGDLCTAGAIAGMDFAGVVMSIGSNVTTAGEITVGDRVCGAVQGMHSLTPTVGAFAQVVAASDVVTLKVPPSMTLEEAASLGSGIGTVGLALYKSLDIPGTPFKAAENPGFVLVYGGSTATGTLALQILKL